MSNVFLQSGTFVIMVKNNAFGGRSRRVWIWVARRDGAKDGMWSLDVGQNSLSPISSVFRSVHPVDGSNIALCQAAISLSL